MQYASFRSNLLSLTQKAPSLLEAGSFGQAIEKLCFYGCCPVQWPIAPFFLRQEETPNKTHGLECAENL